MKYLKKIADDQQVKTLLQPEKLTKDDRDLFQTEKRSMLEFKNLLRHIAGRANIFITQIGEEGVEKIFFDKLHYNFLDNLNKMIEKFLNPDEEIEEMIISENKELYWDSYNAVAGLHEYLSNTPSQKIEEETVIKLLRNVKELFNKLDEQYKIS